MSHSAKFERAFQVLVEHEGGFSNDAADPGGATMLGMSLRTLRAKPDWDGDGVVDADLDQDGDIDADDVRGLTLDHARKYYWCEWWARYGYDRLDGQRLPTKVFDMAVNMGPSRAHMILQEACRDLGSYLVIDGDLGPKTVSAANMLQESALMRQVCIVAAKFYRALATRKPAMKRFLRGWLRRAKWGGTEAAAE